MNKLNIPETYFTPRVEFNSEKGILESEGRVLETDKGTDEDIFTKVSVWVDEYSNDNKDPMTIRFRLSYYNTTSSKKMVKFMRNVEGLFQKGHDIKMEWEYEDGDEDALTDGEIFKNLFTVPFNVTRVKN